MTEDTTKPCGECGASVYPEHIDSGMARIENGKLLCKHCVEDFEKSSGSSMGGGAAGESDVVEFEPIQMEEDDDDTRPLDMSESRVHGTSGATLVEKAVWDEGKYKRVADANAPGACRVRIFHSRLSEGALEYMNNQINDWLDENENISIKYATSTIGLFEGKHAEPNIFMSMFY